MGVYLGATAVGIACREGVVLATDRRATYGTFIASKRIKKTFPVADNVGMACAGLPSDFQRLTKYVKANAELYMLEIGLDKIKVKTCARLLSNILFGRRFLYPFITEIIVGGVDVEGSQIYTLDIVGSVILEKYAAVGSGAELAMGIMEKEYKKDMKIDECEELAVKAVKSAISRDVLTGDGVDLLIIDKKGFREKRVRF